MIAAVALPLVVACGLLAAGGLAALAWLRRKEARGGLLPAALALALLTPSCSVGLVSFPLIDAFSGMAVTGGGGKDALRPVLLQANTGLLAGVFAMLLTLGVALIVLAASLAAGRASQQGELPRASTRRLAFLAALALAPLAIAAPFFEHARENVEIIRLVAFLEQGSPEAAGAGEKHAVLQHGIAEISSRLGRGLTLGSLGAGYVALVLLGIAAAGALVSGAAASPRGFAAGGLLIVLATAGLGVFWLFRLTLELRALSSAGS